MALSWNFKKTFTGNSNYWVEAIATATQSVANNESIITLKTYFNSNSSWSLYGNGIKLATTIDGKTSNTTHNISSAGGKKILLNTRTITLAHKADGTRTFNTQIVLDASMITISGKKLGKADTGSKSSVLNTIPRKSTLSSSKSLTATNDYSCTITRGSSSFTHTLTFKDGSTVLKTVTGIGASKTITFSETERINMLKLVDGVGAKTITAELITYNGSTQMGANNYSINLLEPSRSTLSIPTSIALGGGVNISIKAYSSRFKHTIQYNINGKTGTILSAVGSGTHVYDLSNLTDILYSSYPNSITATTSFTLTTTLGGYTRKNTVSKSFTTLLNQKPPTFPSGAVTYKDMGSSTVAITGNNQYIISGKSQLQVNLTKIATAYNSASIKEYSCSIGGVRKVSTSNNIQDFNMGVVTVKSGDNISITATDTRGLSTTINIPCAVLKYNTPNIIFSAERVSNFESLTKITILCDYSPLLVGGTSKNKVTSLSFRYKKQDTSSYSGYVNLPLTQVNSTQVRGSQTIELDNNFAFDIEGKAVDTMGGTTVVTGRVSQGIPLIFIDTVKNSVGFGGFPQANDSAHFDMKIYAKQGVESNGNITSPKIITQGVESNGNITSPKIITPTFALGGSNLITRKLANGATIIVDSSTNTIIDYLGDRTLWTGALPMSSTESVKLPISLQDCPHGIILYWSARESGETKNHQFNQIQVDKTFTTIFGEGRGMCMLVALGYANGELRNRFQKYVYIHNDQLTGHASNIIDEKISGQVLRAVVVY